MASENGAQSGGFDFKTIVAVAALAVACASLYYTTTVDTRGAVADLEGSIRSLTTKLNEKPESDDVLQLINSDVQPRIDGAAAELRRSLDGIEAEVGSLRGTLGGRPTEDAVRAIAEAVSSGESETLIAERLPELIALNAVPKGAVVAFATSCPTHLGWQEHEAARGRFLVAAGTHTDADDTTRNFVPGVGLNDGEYTHVLTATEMPTHHHTVERQGPTRGITDVPPLGSDGAIIATIEPELTSAAGGGEPHNNVPPYIALHFCEKL